MTTHQPRRYHQRGTSCRVSADYEECGLFDDTCAAVEVFMHNQPPDDDDGRQAVHISDAVDDLFRRDPGDPVAIITDDHRLVFIQCNETVWIDGKPCDASLAKQWKRVMTMDGRSGLVVV